MKPLVVVPFVIALVSYPYWAKTSPVKDAKILAERSDVIISDDGVQIKCDQMKCPENAFRCRVVKDLSAMEADTILRTNTCYAVNGTMISESTRKVFNKGNFHEYLDLSADRDGIVVVNEEMKTGFHLSIKNLASLKGKSPNYVKSIEKTVNDVRKVVSHKVTEFWHKKSAKDAEV